MHDFFIDQQHSCRPFRSHVRKLPVAVILTPFLTKLVLTVDHYKLVCSYYIRHYICVTWAFLPSIWVRIPLPPTLVRSEAGSQDPSKFHIWYRRTGSLYDMPSLVPGQPRHIQWNNGCTRQLTSRFMRQSHMHVVSQWVKILWNWLP